MEESKKKVDKLGQLVGEENAKMLLAKIRAESDLLYDKIAQLTASYSGEMRQKMLDALTGCGTWSETAQDDIMGYLRTEVIDQTVHELLTVAGTLQASAPVNLSTYAQHALVHYEEGVKAVQHSDLRRTVSSLMSAFGVPADLLKKDNTPAPEAPPI